MFYSKKVNIWDEFNQNPLYASVKMSQEIREGGSIKGIRDGAKKQESECV